MSDFLITQNCSANLHEGYRGGMGTEQFNRNIETFLYGPGRTDVPTLASEYEVGSLYKN